MNTKQRNQIAVGANYRVEYERRAFMGLITWWEEKNLTRVDDDLFINTFNAPVGRVIINGEEYKK